MEAKNVVVQGIKSSQQIILSSSSGTSIISLFICFIITLKFVHRNGRNLYTLTAHSLPILPCIHYDDKKFNSFSNVILAKHRLYTKHSFKPHHSYRTLVEKNRHGQKNLNNCKSQEFCCISNPGESIKNYHTSIFNNGYIWKQSLVT